MQHKVRLATLADVEIVSGLWQNFVTERLHSDPTLSIASDFNYTDYVQYHLSKESTYCWLLEATETLLFAELSSPSENVGFLCTYVYTESPPLDLQPSTPFLPRKIGAVLAFYIRPEYRQLEGMNLLIDTAINTAIELQVSDLELLIPEDAGVHNLLERLGFAKVAIQYTKHLQAPVESFGNNGYIEEQIPLRNLTTNEIVRDKSGNIIYLNALKDERGDTLKDSAGFSIYPLPVRDPQTAEWLFNPDGTIALCPPLLDENGQIIESNGLTQFRSPVYEIRDGTIQLKRDSDGNLLFE